MRFAGSIAFYAIAVGLSCGPNSQSAKVPSSVANSSPSGSIAPDMPNADLLEIEAIGIKLRLPGRTAWSQSIDGSGWTVLKKDDTIIRLTKIEETSMVGSTQCELRAQWAGEAPNAIEQKRRRFETVTRESANHPDGWEGLHWVAIEVDRARVIGHVFYFAARRHTCLIVHAEVVKGDTETAENLGDRLELISTVTIGSIEMTTPRLDRNLPSLDTNKF